MDNAENECSNIGISFKNSTMQKFFQEWCQFKATYGRDKEKILAIKDNKKRQAELDNLDRMYKEWKLRAMGTTVGCHQIIRKDRPENDIKVRNILPENQ